MGNPRYQKDGNPRTSGPGFGVTLHGDKLDEPIGWKKPRVVFVNSMSDLFHDAVPEDFIARTFLTMASCPHHTFQVLTKRPGRMASIVQRLPSIARVTLGARFPTWPLPNVWLGTSIENQRWADVRIPKLLETPAAVRFLSCEPLLGEIDIRPWLDHDAAIDWIIAGGESGFRARPVDPRWITALRDQCGDIGVAFFFKQWGGHTAKAGGRSLEGRTWDEMPEQRPALVSR